MALKVNKEDILAIVKLQVPAGKATAAPPIGPQLSQYGVNAGEFANQFNALTQKYPPGQILRVTLVITKDRSFKFEIKGSPTSELIRRAAKIPKGSGKPNLKKVGKLTKSQIEEIAKEKLEDLNTNSIEEAMRIIEGTARQMGVDVIKE